MSIDEEVLQRLEKLQNEDEKSFKSELEKIDTQLFKEHCFKNGYKDECDPAFCVAANTNTCQYLKEMRKIWDKFGNNFQ